MDSNNNLAKNLDDLNSKESLDLDYVASALNGPMDIYATRQETSRQGSI